MIKNDTYSDKSYDDFLAYERVIFKAKEILSLDFNSVLDVGCASGLSLHLLRSHNNNAKFLGIDNDADMISKAKNFFSNEAGATFKISTIESLEDGLKFDLILLWGLISFYDSYEELILKVISHLSESGCISIWSGFSNSEYDVHVSYSKDGSKYPGLNMFSLPVFVSFLERQGLAVEIHKFTPLSPLSKDPTNPLVSYTVRDRDDRLVIVNGLNIVRDFYHLILRRQ